MAKFCKYCGSPLDGDMKFCGACGAQIPIPAQSAQPPQPTPVDYTYAPPAAPPYSAPQPAQPYGYAPAKPAPKKSKKGLIIGLIAGAVVLIGAVVFFIFFNPFASGGNDSPDSVLNIMANSLYSENYSADEYLKTTFEYNYAPDEDTKEKIKENADEYIGTGSAYEEAYEELDGKFSIATEIVDKEILTDSDYDDFIERLTSYTKYRTDAIQQVIKAKIKVTFTGIDKDTEVEQESDSAYFIKADGKWYSANAI